MKQHSFVFKVKIKFNVSTIINTKDKNDACVLVAALLKYCATIRDNVNLAGDVAYQGALAGLEE